MSIKSGNFSIFAEVELNTSKIQSQLNKAGKGAKINIDHSSVTKAGDALEELGVKSKSAAEAGELVELNFQEANMVLSKSIDIITAMVDQVFALDSAITELKKVTDLSGESLEQYVDNLAELGETVGRTGKPKCLAPNVR